MLEKINPDELTPMMRQYYDIKKNFKDSILLFRLGDFYEMFFDDAILASKELELVLTKRDCGLENKAPMCGIPHHTADSYINKLVSKGYRAAICEQLEDPKLAKGLVERNVVRVISPGMNIDKDDYKYNNYLMSFYFEGSFFGLSYIDVSTGEIKYTEIINNHKSPSKVLQDEIAKINPSELLINQNDNKELKKFLDNDKSIFVSYYQVDSLNPKLLMENLEDYFPKKSLKDLKKRTFASISLSYLMDYVYSFQKESLKHFRNPEFQSPKDHMGLSAETRYNLDISAKPDHDRSLVNLLNRTKTPMGSRMLNSWIENPLVDKKEIMYRQELVAYFKEEADFSSNISSLLNEVYDIERIIGKLSYSRANARDLLALKNSIEILPRLKTSLKNVEIIEMKKLISDLDELKDIYKLIEEAIVEDPPSSISEGGLIKEGFSNELDRIRKTSLLGKKELKEYEKEEREKTSISNLKIVHNKNTGYFLDVTKSHLDKVPADYHKMQTLTNSDRFITPRLKEIENMIFTSGEDTVKLEEEIFNSIRDKISSDITKIQKDCDILAYLDCCLSLGELAYDNSYCKPNFNDLGIIDIKNGRHPMIEEAISKINFIPNDIEINDDNLIQIITGPNMSGKSTYLRQTALICIMAQIGSFVPADSANLSIVDQIFTRIGASDNIIYGDSTFMVEMKEMANIINNASSNSLLLLDEVGRGTSTYDGLSIAWAIVEYISKKIKAKTLFATHYQELTQLSSSLDNVENYSIKVKEDIHGIIFLYKIEKKSTSRSFGIEVAKLAGLPRSIISRAQTILAAIEETSSFKINEDKLEPRVDFTSQQKNKLIDYIKNIQINELSPIEGLNILNDIIDNAKLIEDDEPYDKTTRQ